TLEISDTPEAIWDVISRYMHIDEFAPFVKSVDALTTGEDAVGSKRRNNFTNGTSMVEEVTEWTPNRGYRVQASEFGTLPFREVEAQITLGPLGNGRSKVTWALDFRPKYGPLGWLMGQTIMKISMGKLMDANLKGLSERVAIKQTENTQPT
ncbi:MAG: SRPBCC family protein, partial [bacterium]|nr:SRPBCC family protein [bacterium]